MNSLTGNAIALLLVGMTLSWNGCAHMASTKMSVVDLESWPEGSSPQEIGKRVAEHYATSPFGGPARKTMSNPI